MSRALRELPVRHPGAIVLVALLALVFGLSQLVDPADTRLRLSIDASLRGLLPADGHEYEVFEAVRDRFGGDDVLLVAWFDDALFSAQHLRAMKKFTRRVQRLDGVARVDGLATAIEVRDVDGNVSIERLLKRIPRTDAALAELAERATGNPLFRGQFVNDTADGALMAVHFDPRLDSPALSKLVTAISDLSAAFAGDAEQLVSGPIHARLAISGTLFRDIRAALPLAVILTALVAAITLRSVHGVLLPLLSTGLGLTLTLALFVVNGQALNFVTAIMPPVVFVVGFALAVHVITEFDRRVRAGHDREARNGEADKREAAIAATVDEVFVPLTLTAVTTTVGFASLMTSPIGAISAFGAYTALGTVLCWLGAVMLLPAALRFMPLRQGVGRTARPSAIAPALARFNTAHRPRILGAGLIVVLLSLWSASSLEVSTDYLGNFSATHPVRANFDRIRGEFSGAVPLQILVSSDVDEAFTDPLHLAALEDFEAWLEAQPEIGGATTLVDFIAILNRAFEGPAARSFPLSQGEVQDLLFLAGGDELERFADARFRQTLLHVRSSSAASAELSALIERIEARLAQLPGHLHGEVTGSSALLARTLDDIVIGQLTSLVGALLVIYVILVLLFGSARIGALALLPNALPIVCFFGLLSACGITLNLATSLVAAVVLGIAVDDTMHFLARFNAEARRTASEARGLENALGVVIRPVTVTTIALCCGFLALTTGELRSQVEFGALAAATLAIAWVIDLTVTPALAGRLRFVTLWEVLTVDLGAAPHQTIPFFAGLTHRQARIAAILGTMEAFERNDVILHEGDSGEDIHVFIEGEAEAYIGDGNDRTPLRRLARGDLIGEVALFKGRRTASVAATTRVRLLRFDREALARIDARYPRVAARLYHNLGEILAERLADVTGRL